MTNAHGNGQDGLAVYLHFYTKRICLHEKIIFYPGEQRRICLSGAKLETAFPVTFLLEREGEVWRVDRKLLSEDAFCILKTQALEEVILILSGRKKSLEPCGRILLCKRSEVSVGNGFRNEIFYDCFSFIASRHIRIYRKKEGFVMESAGPGKDGEMTGLYVNGRAVSESRILERGDHVELWGLSLLYLGEILICTAFYGTLRTAERREPPLTVEPAGEEPAAEVMLSENPPEEALHTGELELSMPPNLHAQGEGPLALTLGPSLTMVVPVMLMAMLGSALTGGSGADYYRISMVMTVSTAFLSVFWGMANHMYRKREGERELVRSKEIYREYLSKTEKYLSVCLKENQTALTRKYPSCEAILAGRGRVLWNRTGFREEFLFVRLGLGAIPFQIQIRSSGKNRELDQDVLAQEAYELMDRFRMLPSVPVGIALAPGGRAGFAGPGIYPVLLQALVQLAACHDSRDMKLAFFYDKQDREESQLAACLKWLPHVWSRTKKVRFLAGSEKEAGEILPELRKELEQEEGIGEGGPFYLLAAAGRSLAWGESSNILCHDRKEKVRVYTLFAHREREKLPGCCGVLVLRDGEQEEIVSYEKERVERQLLTLEECRAEQAEKYMRKMTGIRPQREEEAELREKVSFLELYSCQKVEELNCCGRWKESQTRDRIRVPVGMGRGGRMIYLDIHEKFHGPHGLVAGTTGSGKSELLQTYLLSLAVSFGPEDINFFIIDYKGGGMGNGLSALPHCAGVISNLSGRQIKRALSSIKSENRRRQKLFQLFGVNHVEDYSSLYREGRVEEPVPHLLLVVDEFAELKREEPEFMQEIISVAQVGRSLGVHLLLATQKPAGTVDDKIWSNTRFRLCLRVAERQDSLDMLHRPEAAYLTGAGQCYIQVGNDELYELFQAGYSGGEYLDGGQCEERAFLVLGTGKRLGEGRREGQGGPSQMEAVTEYICRVSEQVKSRKARKLWMPELPESLSLSALRTEKGREGELRLCLGLCDDPECQMQYPLLYDPERDGHLLLCGGSATGKSTFLQTVLWQLCREYSPGQVQILLAGADNAGVNCFEDMPHCLGNMKSAREADCFFYHVERLFEKRKELLKGISFGQYRRHSREPESIYFLAVDGYGSFREMTQDRYQELIEKLAGEGINYGIYLILTASGAGSGEIPGKLFEKIKTTLSLEMSDRFQYGDILRRYQVSVWPRENVKGRGLCRMQDRILEFQVPLIAPEDDYQRIDRIGRLAEERKALFPGGRRAEKFPVVPQKPRYGAMAEEFQSQGAAEDEIPVGYEEISGYIRRISLGEGGLFLVSGAEQTGKRNLLLCMMEGIWKTGRHVALFDRKAALCKRAQRAAGGQGKLCLISDEDSFVSWYRQLEKKEKKWCLCLWDLADFSRMLESCGTELRDRKRELEQRMDEGIFPPMIALQRPGKETDALGTFIYELFVERQWGIHLGGNAGNQRMLHLDDLGYSQMSQAMAPGSGYFKPGPFGKTERIRIPLYDDIG